MSKGGESERTITVHHVEAGGTRVADDHVAVEEPLEIRVAWGDDVPGRSARSLSITMRTPGNDFELAAGFLFTEGLLDEPAQIRDLGFCGPPAPGRATSNIVRVELASGVKVDLDGMERHFFASSSCGICGKATLEALRVPGLESLEGERPVVRRSAVHRLPGALRAAQPLFERTGGIHAAGLFDAAGRLLDVREDVGRHNAVDKLLGRRFLDGAMPLADRVMTLSGRASYEILQKALRARVPVIVAVGAPSSLAIDLAEEFGMTLVGFAAADRFNVYAGHSRIVEG